MGNWGYVPHPSTGYCKCGRRVRTAAGNCGRYQCWANDGAIPPFPAENTASDATAKPSKTDDPS